METLTVTRDVDGNRGLEFLPIRKIAYMEYLKNINRVVVHTTNQEFYLMGTLQYWQRALEMSGYNFVFLDRGNVVNLDKIVLLDAKYHVAYFEENISKESKRCTLTSIKFKEIQQSLGTSAIVSWA